MKRSQLIIPLTPAADHRGKEGYFVDLSTGTAAISTTATVKPFGLITDGGNTDGDDAIALPGYSGTVLVKVTGTTPGSIVKGSRLMLAAEDGTVKLDSGTGARVVVAEALEIGEANELIEARLLPEFQVFGADVTDGTTNGAASGAADLAALKTETEAIGDALRALLTALDDAGVIVKA